MWRRCPAIAPVVCVGNRCSVRCAQNSEIGRELSDRVCTVMPLLRRDGTGCHVDEERQKPDDERREAPVGTPPLDRRGWLSHAHEGLPLSVSAHDTSMERADN